MIGLTGGCGIGYILSYGGEDGSVLSYLRRRSEGACDIGGPDFNGLRRVHPVRFTTRIPGGSPRGRVAFLGGSAVALGLVVVLVVVFASSDGDPKSFTPDQPTTPTVATTTVAPPPPPLGTGAPLEVDRTPRWTNQLGDFLALAGDVVALALAAAGELGIDRLDVSTGERIEDATSIPGTLIFEDPIVVEAGAESLALVKSTVFKEASGLERGTETPTLTAVELASGKIAWSIAVGGDIAAANTDYFVIDRSGFLNGKVEIFDTKTGTSLGTLADLPTESLTLDGTILLCSGLGGMKAVELPSGNTKWENKELSGLGGANVIAANGRALIELSGLSGSRDLLIDTSTGRTVTSLEVNSPEAANYDTESGILVVQNGGAQYTGLRLADGAVLWTLPKEQIFNVTATFDGVAYGSGAEEGSTFAIDLRTGEDYQLDIAGTVVAARGGLVIARESETLTAYAGSR